MQYRWLKDNAFLRGFILSVFLSVVAGEFIVLYFFRFTLGLKVSFIVIALVMFLIVYKDRVYLKNAMKRAFHRTFKIFIRLIVPDNNSPENVEAIYSEVSSLLGFLLGVLFLLLFVPVYPPITVVVVFIALIVQGFLVVRLMWLLKYDESLSWVSRTLFDVIIGGFVILDGMVWLRATSYIAFVIGSGLFSLAMSVMSLIYTLLVSFVIVLIWPAAKSLSKAPGRSLDYIEKHFLVKVLLFLAIYLFPIAAIYKYIEGEKNEQH